MSEVITDKDREYEAREQASAPGADQAMGDRVNNRSLRPRSEAFKEFMRSGWADEDPHIAPLASSPHVARRWDAGSRVNAWSFPQASPRYATTIAITCFDRTRPSPITPGWERITRPEPSSC